MRKKELLIISFLIVISLLSIGIFYFAHDTEAPLYVRITQNGTILGQYPLDQNITEVFETDLGYNTLIIENKTAKIKDADCPNQICVNTFAISKPGETIVCLPHKLVIEVVTD